MTLTPMRTLIPHCTILLFLALSACKKEGPTPSFIRIQSPEAHTHEGTPTPHGISDFWVYVGDEAIGVEIEERYAEIIARRLDQAVLPL